jgi:hypothetical protein
MEMRFVLCAVGTEYLRIICMNFTLQRAEICIQYEETRKGKYILVSILVESDR